MHDKFQWINMPVHSNCQYAPLRTDRFIFYIINVFRHIISLLHSRTIRNVATFIALLLHYSDIVNHGRKIDQARFKKTLIAVFFL